MKIDKIKKVNKNDPMAPEYVLFGLIFVNLGPLNVFPTIKPPTSDAIHPNNNKKTIIFNCKIFEQ